MAGGLGAAGETGAGTQTSASVALSEIDRLDRQHRRAPLRRRRGERQRLHDRSTRDAVAHPDLCDARAEEDPERRARVGLPQRALDRRAPVDVVGDDVRLHLEPRRAELATHPRQRLGGDRAWRLGDHQHHAAGRFGPHGRSERQRRQQSPSTCNATASPAKRGARQHHCFSMSLAASAYEPVGNRCRYSSASIPADDEARRLSINILRPSACAA